MKIKQINETIIKEKLENGLEVYIHQNVGFNETYANYTVKYGSNDLEYIDCELKNHKTIMGIAHYLEHVMFVTEDNKDYFDLFSKIGSSANAYTGFTQTSYIVSCSQNIEKNLEILLNETQKLNIDEKSVDKERFIIEEEIQMYLQNPSFVLQSEMFKNISNANYKYDIAGTSESIKKIKVEELYNIFSEFYNPNNCILYISTFDNPQHILDFLKNNQIIKTKKEVTKIKKKETIYIKESNTKINFKKLNIDESITVFKYPGFEDKLKEIQMDITLDLLTEYICSDNNKIYSNLLKEKKINSSMYMSNYLDEDFNIIYFKISDKINFDIEKFYIDSLNSITESKINTLIRKKIAQEIKVYNNPVDIVENNINRLVRSIQVEIYFDQLYLFNSKTFKNNLEKLKSNYKKNKHVIM